MKEQNPEIEQWARRLAGTTTVDDADPQLDALRVTIESSDRRLSDSSAADRLAHARLIRRLESEGLLSTRVRWRRWIGAAAAVMIATIGLRIASLPHAVDRGVAGSLTIAAEHPEVEIAQVSQQLEALGLQPRTVTEDEALWIEVDVPHARLPAFYAWAHVFGGRPVVAGSYRIFIHRESAASR